MSALTNPTGTITVNVGGTVYTTTLATLTRVEGSMLGALAEALSDDEVLFIDRDGPSFRYVLNYLRDPFAKPLLPRDSIERVQLAREVDFYGLPGLSYGMNLAGPFVVSFNNQVATINTHENYELAFTMELASDWSPKFPEWQSVLVIHKSHADGTEGHFLPKITFHSSKNLHVIQSSNPDYIHTRWGVESTTGVAFAAGGTYEVKVLVANNKMAVYVNGVSVGTASGSGTGVATDAAVYVGWRTNGYARGVTLSDISYTGR